jgi:hypothetical protein
MGHTAHQEDSVAVGPSDGVPREPNRAKRTRRLKRNVDVGKQAAGHKNRRIIGSEYRRRPPIAAVASLIGAPSACVKG